jgi:microcin C transport system substrate-binding protein
MRNKFFNFIALFLLILPDIAFANKITISDYVSISNAPKYDRSFKNFEYVNPNAPKKGSITLPAYGTFDNFNPYIFKGTASTETAQLTLDSLAVTPADDIGSAYPLIAQYFELPKDKSFVGFFKL